MRVDFRIRWALGAFVWTTAVGSFDGSVLAAEASKGTGGIMAPGPDIEAAVQSEYDGVIRKGTREAYERFIRRHPDHPLAEKAREALAKGNLR